MVSLDMCVYVLVLDGRVLEFCDFILSIIFYNVLRLRLCCDLFDLIDVIVILMEFYMVIMLLVFVFGKLFCCIFNFS